jgi:DNA-binding transcriptional LysR family regulator
MVDVRRLRVLCEVARQGSFSSAAVALGYSQPAVSRQVALLEAEVGAMLVRRLAQGVVLTDAGRVLVARGEAILAQLDDLEVEIGALAGLEGGRLRFAAFASACASIVPLAIARFRERYPAVEFSVTMSDPNDSVPRLRAGEFDLVLSHDPEGGGRDAAAGVCAGGEHSGGRTAGIEFVRLFDDPMYVAVSAQHPLARVSPLSLDRFGAESWMLATPSSCPDSRLLLRACHAAGFEPRIAFQNDDYSVILGFVAAGVGVALIPDMVARGAREDVIIRELDPAPPGRPISALLPAGYRSPSATAMLEVLSEVSEEWTSRRTALSAPGSRVG